MVTTDHPVTSETPPVTSETPPTSDTTISTITEDVRVDTKATTEDDRVDTTADTSVTEFDETEVSPNATTTNGKKWHFIDMSLYH